MLAKIFGRRPLAVETAKHGFAVLLRHSGAFIADADDDLVLCQSCGDLDQSTLRRERNRIVDQIGQHPFQPDIFAQRRCHTAPRPRKRDGHTRITTAIFARLQQLLDHVAQIDTLELRLGQLRIHATGIGYIADQPVHAVNVGFRHIHQLGPQRRVFDPVSTVERGTQRRQRVLYFMRNISGKGLGRIDPLP